VKLLCAEDDQPNNRLEFDLIQYLRGKYLKETIPKEGGPLLAMRLEHEVGLNQSIQNNLNNQMGLNSIVPSEFETMDSRRVKALSKINGILKEHRVFTKNSAIAQLGTLVVDLNFAVLNLFTKFFAEELNSGIIEKLNSYQQGAWSNFQEQAIPEKPPQAEEEKEPEEKQKIKLPDISQFTDLTEADQAIQCLDRLTVAIFTTEEALARLGQTLEDHWRSGPIMLNVKKEGNEASINEDDDAASMISMDGTVSERNSFESLPDPSETHPNPNDLNDDQDDDLTVVTEAQIPSLSSFSSSNTYSSANYSTTTNSSTQSPGTLDKRASWKQNLSILKEKTSAKLKEKSQEARVKMEKKVQEIQEKVQEKMQEEKEKRAARTVYKKRQNVLIESKLKQKKDEALKEVNDVLLELQSEKLLLHSLGTAWSQKLEEYEKIKLENDTFREEL